MRKAVLGALLFVSVFATPVWTLAQASGTRPDPALALVVAIALRVAPAVGGAVGFGTGLMTAAATGWSPGAFMVSRTVVGFAVGYARRIVLGESVWVTLAATCIASVVCDAFFSILNPRATFEVWGVRALAGAGMNGVCAIPAHYLTRWALGRQRLVFPRT